MNSSGSKKKKQTRCFAPNTGWSNVVKIVPNNISKDNDEHFDYPYYIACIQRHGITTKRWSLQEKCSKSKEIAGIVTDNSSSIHAFNRFGLEGNVEWFQCHLRSISLTGDDPYDIGVPAIIE